jgi:hypothetical protein
LRRPSKVPLLKVRRQKANEVCVAKPIFDSSQGPALEARGETAFAAGQVPGLERGVEFAINAC